MTWEHLNEFTDLVNFLLLYAFCYMLHRRILKLEDRR